MDKVHKNITTQYYTPSPKPFRMLAQPMNYILLERSVLVGEEALFDE
jgi:hypothetical protein